MTGNGNHNFRQHTERFISLSHTIEPMMMRKNEEIPNQETLDEARIDIKAIMNRFDDFETRLRKLEGFVTKEPQILAKSPSIREFLLREQPKSDVEKTFMIGSFLERNRSFNSFNARDLTEGFREAKETIPSNVNLAALMNVRKGLFMEAKEKKDGFKAWTLTNSGLGYFEDKGQA